MTNGNYPPDYTTSVGQVRLLIPDAQPTPAPDLEYIFGDAQITALLGLFNGNVKRAAAQAKDIIATDQVLLLKVVRTDDLSVDGAKVAAELRIQAKSLRDLADRDDEVDVLDYFTIVYPTQTAYPEGVPLYGRSRVEIIEIDR